MPKGVLGKSNVLCYSQNNMFNEASYIAVECMFFHIQYVEVLWIWFICCMISVRTVEIRHVVFVLCSFN